MGDASTKLARKLTFIPQNMVVLNVLIDIGGFVSQGLAVWIEIPQRKGNVTRYAVNYWVMLVSRSEYTTMLLVYHFGLCDDDSYILFLFLLPVRAIIYHIHRIHLLG